MNNLNDQYFKTKKIHKKGFKKWGWILWISLFLLFLTYVYQDIQGQLKSKGIVQYFENTKEVCLPASEFKFGEISLSDNLQTIKNKLGIPDSIEQDTLLNTETWFYKNQNIDITNNHIYNMECKNKDISTPSGIRLGITKNRFNKILWGKNSEKYGLTNGINSFQIVNCKTEYYVVCEFTSDRLTKLEMGIDLP